MSSGPVQRVEEADPGQQGLKHSLTLCAVCRRPVEEADPGQQGLKLVSTEDTDRDGDVEEADPGQQGLKHPEPAEDLAGLVTLRRPIQDNKD